VLLVETDSSGALSVAERIRDGFRGHRFLQERGLGLAVTASLGVASYPRHTQDATSLLQAADQAMYRVKAAGRDDVACAPDRGESPAVAG
jgi:diguanylate cyclase